MGNSLTTFETSGMHPSHRIESWADALTRLCGKLDTDGFGASTLDGSIEYATVDRLKLCSIEASRHRITLSPDLARMERHPVIKVIFQEHGSSTYEQDGERVTVSAGDGIAYDVSRPHQITSSSMSKHFAVIVPKDAVPFRGMLLNKLPAQCFSSRHGVGRLSRDMVRSTLAEMSAISQSCEREIAQSLLTLLPMPLAAIPRAGRDAPASALIRKIKAYIQANLQDPELSIDRIASALDCSKSYLHRCFAHEGMSITSYIWTTRLEICRRELASAPHDMSITEIAFSHGFNSSSHFSRLFKKRFGVAPSRFPTA